ncbi:chondroadherin-like [Uloborus diversus]|uniref:chondroadherin-like n=1 Tax=Uloborus diversus TaxID=327109 RepID=UPI0024098B85|nr:chondroadherin-like [Uloborus diversus]
MDFYGVAAKSILQFICQFPTYIVLSFIGLPSDKSTDKSVIFTNVKDRELLKPLKKSLHNCKILIEMKKMEKVIHFRFSDDDVVIWHRTTGFTVMLLLPAYVRMNLASLAAAIMTAATCIVCSHGQQHYDCPLPQHVSPCSCVERSHGLDVTCADISSIQLREVLDVVGLTRQTLWFMRITRAELFMFPKNLLDGLDIRNLIIVQSNISALEQNVFTGDASKIESLDLAMNCLDRVPTRALSTLKSLAALSLDNNLIETLEAHAFSKLESLLWLSLYGNKIRLIDSRAFLGTEASLTRLNLGGNRLGQVPRYALQRLNCLQGMRLHENNISEILVENLPVSLCDLDLSGNDIVELEPESFVTLKHLSALDLEDNRIRSIHPDAFHGVHDSLEWLKLGGNQLTSIPHSAFQNFSRLRQLDLRCNLVTKVSLRSFEAYGKSLKFIFLQKNSIQTIEDGALDVLESAQWLYLHSNQLTELKYDTFKSVIDNLHVLDLHDNPFACECDTLWFRDWLVSKGQNVVNLPKETKCAAPKQHAQKPIVKLANSSFACSCAFGLTSAPTNTFGVFSLIFLSIFMFFMCR